MDTKAATGVKAPTTLGVPITIQHHCPQCGVTRFQLVNEFEREDGAWVEIYHCVNCGYSREFVVE